mmetsp:Transcript_26725/g.41465  ORF Transcript_26725/g.41465 Transcript_26725/m.41465 type:complete len:274 (-) Transcript_26725:572-1393(-)
MLQKNNPRARITKDRIDILNDIGFEWALQDSHWQQYFEELQRYKVLYGDCYVTSRYGSAGNLGGWVKRQRAQYRNMVQNKSHSLTPEKIRKLESLNFDFNVGRKTLRNLNSVKYGISRSAALAPVASAATQMMQLQNKIMQQQQQQQQEQTATDKTVRNNDIVVAIDHHDSSTNDDNASSDHVSVVATGASNLNSVVATSTSSSESTALSVAAQGNTAGAEYDDLLYRSYQRQEQLQLELNKVKQERDMWKQKFEDFLSSSSSKVGASNTASL